MSKWKVYQRRELNRGGPDHLVLVTIRPVATLDAPTAEAALRIAKQKGWTAPIIGSEKDYHANF